MKVKSVFSILVSLAFTFSFTNGYAAEFDLKSDPNYTFDIVLTREGEESLYFSSPDNYDSQILDSLAFDLLDYSDGVGQTDSIPELWVGVVWNLYPDQSVGQAGIKLMLQASSTSSYSTSEGFMLQEMSASSQGLNFSIYGFNDVAAGTRPKEGSADSSSVISSSEVNTKLPSERREINLAKHSGTDNGSSSGTALVKLKLMPPSYEGQQAQAFMDGDYKGYLILHVETF